jgi:hypothetical protein
VDLPSPILNTKSGFILLEDFADPEVREAMKQAIILTGEPPPPPQIVQPAGIGGGAPGQPVPGKPGQTPAGKSGQPTPGNKPGQASPAPAAVAKRSEEMSLLMEQLTTLLETILRVDPVHDSKTGEFGTYSGPKTTGTKATSTKATAHKTTSKKASAATGVAKDRAAVRAFKLAVRFDKMAARKVGKNWTTAQQSAAAKLGATFSHLGKAITAGDQQSVDGLLSTAWSQAKGLLAGNSKGLASMSHTLIALDTSNEKGLLRSIDDGLPEEEEEPEGESEEDDEEDSWLSIALGEDDDEDEPPPPVSARALSDEYRRWYDCALRDVKAGRTVRDFASTVIPSPERQELASVLRVCVTPDEIRTAFQQAKERNESRERPEEEREAHPKVGAVSGNGDGPRQNRNAWKLRW